VNVVDSSGWIEYFVAGPNSRFFAKSIEEVDELIVPTICLNEVFRWVARERTETEALRAVAHMQLGEVVELDSYLAIYAARLGLQAKLPLADSVVLATARLHQATLWTQDSDLEKFTEVKYIAKSKSTK
jgi:predicted nucleic acid-binding protein